MRVKAATLWISIAGCASAEVAPNLCGTALATVDGTVDGIEEAHKKAGQAGYDPGQDFLIKPEDDLFSLRVGLQAGYRFEPTWVEGDSVDRRAFYVLRPVIAGHLYKKWITFWNTFEFASNPPFLLDSFVDIQPIPEAGVRIGQQFTPFSRHEYLGPHQILFPDWAPVADYFWTGHDKGVTALGVLANGRIEYWAGVYSGTPLRQFRAISGNYLLQGRVTVNPMGSVGPTEFAYIVEERPLPWRVSFTLQGYHGDIQTAIENFNPSTFRFDTVPSGMSRRTEAGSVDCWLQGPRFIALVEGHIRRTNPAGVDPTFASYGVWGQVGYMVLARTLDLGLRLSWLNPSDDIDNDTFTSVEVQVGYYPFHSPRFKVQVRYGYGEQQNPGAIPLGATRLLAPVGDINLVTAQLLLVI